MSNTCTGGRSKLSELFLLRDTAQWSLLENTLEVTCWDLSTALLIIHNMKCYILNMYRPEVTIQLRLPIQNRKSDMKIPDILHNPKNGQTNFTQMISPI